MLTPQDIACADSITGLALSKDASRVVYSVGPVNRPGEHSTSALWLAQTASAGSSKQITSGTSHDHNAVFHPDGSYIYFLSDRHKVGGSAQIYRLPVFSREEDPVPVTSVANTRAVLSFLISPNGKQIAFISSGEPTDEEKAQDVEIWGEKRDLGRLLVLDLNDSSKEQIRTLVSVEAHVDSFTWSPDSSQIAYRLSRSPDIESNFHNISEHIVHLVPILTNTPWTLEHPRMPGSRTVWTKGGNLFFIASVTRESPVSSDALWMCTVSECSPTKIAYGETEDSISIVDLGLDAGVAVEVASGLNTRIDIVDSTGKIFTVFETDNDSIAYMEWDIKRADGGSYFFVALRSSGPSGDPQNIWSGSTEIDRKGALSRELSFHHEWVAGKNMPISKPFYWKSSDDQDLQGVISYPPGIELFNLPTVVVPHGGPYGRDSLSLSFSYDMWGPLLASQGYLVLSPNYRGSCGRGDTFAKAADGGMGTLDWADIKTMIDEAIEQKIADPGRLGIAGDSQGGFLAAWGCTRPDSPFKAGVICAGPTEWGTLSMTSDMPGMEARLGGGAPWSPGEPDYIKGSPIRYVKNVKIPLLILHGKEDKRVPVTQSTGFMHGLMSESDMGKESQLIIYPREGHVFEERGHAEDVCRRLVEYLDRHLKQASTNTCTN